VNNCQWSVEQGTTECGTPDDPDASCCGTYQETVLGREPPCDYGNPFACEAGNPNYLVNENTNQHYSYLNLLTLSGAILECSLNMSFDLTFFNESYSGISSAVISVPHYDSGTLCSCNWAISTPMYDQFNLVVGSNIISDSISCNSSTDFGYYSFNLSVTALSNLYNQSIQDNYTNYGVINLYMAPKNCNPFSTGGNAGCTCGGTLIPTYESVKLFIVTTRICEDTPCSFMICEGDYPIPPIICPNNTTVRLISAQYGRFNLDQCINEGSNSGGSNTLCEGVDVTAVLQAFCSGSQCVWDTNVDSLANGVDACPGIYKQVKGTYICE